MSDKLQAVVEAARISHQSALLVLCAIRNDQVWKTPMLADIDFAIEANRNLLDAFSALDAQPAVCPEPTTEVEAIRAFLMRIKSDDLWEASNDAGETGWYWPERDGRSVIDLGTVDPGEWSCYAKIGKYELMFDGKITCPPAEANPPVCPTCGDTRLVLEHPADVPFSQSLAAIGDCPDCTDTGNE